MSWRRFRARSNIEKSPALRFVRSVAAVAIGFVLFLAAIHFIPARTDVEVPGTTALHFLVVSAVCTVLAALVSGFVTAWIADWHEIPHAGALGMLMILASFVSMLRAGETHPGWYETAIAGCGPVSAMLGAALRMLTKKRS